MFQSGANYSKLKTNLRLCISRLKLLEKKKTELSLKARKEIADYISSGKYERARIRVEHIIREDYLVEAMEMVEMYCDLLLARFGLIQQMKIMDEGLAEPISSLIWAAPRLQTDVPEFKVISDQLTLKYGKQYTQCVLMNTVDTMNPRLVQKLGVQAPSKILVEKYMIEIAKSNNVPYEPDPDIMRDDDGPAEDTLIYLDDDFKPPGGPPDGGGGDFSVKGFVPPPPPIFQPFNYPQPPQNTYPANSEDPPPYSLVNPMGFVRPPNQLYPVIPPPNTQEEKPPLKPPRGKPNNGHLNNSNSDIAFPELPSVPATAPAADDSLDFDYLAKRFEELKKKPM